MRRCAICGELVESRPMRLSEHPHYQTLHQDFLAWSERPAKGRRLVGIALLPILVLSIILWAAYRDGYLYLVVFAVVLDVFFLFYSLIWVGWRGVRRFRRAWEQEHGGTPK